MKNVFAGVLLAIGLVLSSPAFSQSAGWVFPTANTYSAAAGDSGKALSSESVVASSITVALPNPATVGPLWSMSFSTANGRGIVVNPPVSTYILAGQKTMQSMTLPSNTNYEFATIVSDGTNFRLTNSTRQTSLYNNIVGEAPGGESWIFLFSSGFAIQPAHNGLTISTGLVGTNTQTTLTLPSISLLPNGWSVGIYQDNGNRATINVNGVSGGNILTLDGRNLSTYSLPTASRGYATLQFDGSNFRLLFDTTVQTPDLIAASYGVIANGTVSDDVAMQAAVSACSAVGATLKLPQGPILLDGTGGQSILLSNCHIVGQGTFIDAGQNFGSTFLLTSTTIKPFVVGNDWSFDGVNFYWPNQTSGTTVYPCLFSDNGTNDAGHWKLHNVAIVNAYDGFCATTDRSWGGWFVSNSFMYAVNDLFRIGVMGDFGNMSNVILDPGPWYRTRNFDATVTNAVKAANLNNTIFHATGSPAILARSGVGGFEWRNISAFAWRYGVKQDDQSAINLTSIDISGDTIGTYHDTHLVTTANTLSPGSIKWTCPNSCGDGSLTAGTKAPAFDLSPLGTGSLFLDTFRFGSGVGTFIQTAGSTVHVKNSTAATGDPGDGNDYYILKVTGAAGNKIRVLNSELSGNNTIHSHGIYKHVALTDIQILNNRFEGFNDAIDITDNDGVAPLIVGNVSTNTFGAQSVLVTATNQVNWWNNQFDKPPLAQVSTCGSGASITGTVAGTIQVGSTNPTTSCTLTLPWNTYGDGLCTFGLAAGGAVNYTVSSFHPLTISITSATTMHGARLWYSCPGRQ